MTKTTAAGGMNTRLALLGLVLLAVCLCLGLAGGLAWGYFASRGRASEPAVEYILDASPRMAEANPTTGQESRFEVARAVLAEIVRPADGRVSAGLRVFGNGAQPDACRDTALLVPLAPASQARISAELSSVQAGQIADAALAESMISAIRDLDEAAGPHTLVVVTGGQDSCNPEASQLIAQEADRAGIELETFVVGFQVPEGEAEAIRSMVEDTPGGTYLEAHDRAGLEAILKAIQSRVDERTRLTVDNVIATARAVPPAATPGRNLDIAEAAQIVEDEVVVPGTLGHEVIVFPWPEPLGPDDLLLPWAAPELGAPPDPIPVSRPSWFFWIDDFPAGKFAHPSRFVLVDIDTGAVTVSEQQWWPMLNGQGLWVEPAEYWNPERWSFTNFEADPVGFPARRAPSGAPLARPGPGPARQATGRGVALVLNGWQAGEAGSAALTVDAAGVRAAFEHAGLATTYLGITADGSGSGDYSPAAVNAWATEQAAALVPGDSLVVYLTGHGDATALAGLSPAALGAALQAFDAGVHIIVILDGSYSGAFIPALAPLADRVITAAAADTPALFDHDPVSDPNGAGDTGSEFTSGFVEDWEGILSSPGELAAAQQRAEAETRPLWDVLAELSFHSAVAKDAGVLTSKTVPQMVPAQQPTPTPSLTPSPTLTPEPTLTPTPTLPPPTATFTRPPPTATFTPTATPEPFLNFTADKTAVAAGECATLSWDSGNIQSLFLNQEGVVGSGTRQVCVRATTTYTMVANHAGGQITRQVTIEVTSGDPPSLGVVTASDEAIWSFSACGSTSVTLSVGATGADSVTLFYRVLPPDSSPTAWQSLPASPAPALVASGTWVRVLTAGDLPAYGTVEYYFVATNTAGSVHTASRADVDYFPCIE